MPCRWQQEPSEEGGVEGSQLPLAFCVYTLYSCAYFKVRRLIFARRIVTVIIKNLAAIRLYYCYWRLCRSDASLCAGFFVPSVWSPAVPLWAQSIHSFIHIAIGGTF